VEIGIGSLLEGAARARGAVAVIDVFRAFTTAAVVLANNAARVVMVAGVDEALALRSRGVGSLCIGEVGGVAPAGFDFGNSPLAVSGVDFTGRSIIQRSSAGPQGLVAAAARARRLYAAALVTARATARALAAAEDEVWLVAMGEDAVRRSDEDELCALHLRQMLLGRPGAAAALRQVILAGADAARFFDPARPYLPAGDLDIALAIDRYDFAVRVTMEAGLPVARRERAA
jgi:2-phosphosulfolactate phosphatase